MVVVSSDQFSAPPRQVSAGAARAGKPSARAATGKKAERREALDGVAQLVGFGCVIMRQYADAGAIGLHKDPIIDELVTLADSNEKIAKGIDYITEAGPYAGLVVAVMPLVMQLAANHKIVKAELVAGAGVVPPQALESQVRADMARQAAVALRQQQEAEQELATLAAQMRPQDGSGGSPEANGQQTPPKTRGRGSHSEKIGAE